MKKITIILTLLALVLSGCSSNKKDEKYNKMSPTDIYRQGTKNVSKKNYAEAIEDFEALESRYPFGDFADRAQLGSFYAYYKNEDYPSALPAVERFIRMYPRHSSVDYAYYMKGLIHFNESMGFFGKYLPTSREDRDPTHAMKSLQAFNTLVSAFPNSQYAPDAKQRMIYLRNLLAKSELVAANFYMKKGAYLAAATRANYVITHFNQSPSMEEALVIMVKAYRQLGMNDLAKDSERLLVLNYPKAAEKLG